MPNNFIINKKSVGIKMFSYRILAFQKLQDTTLIFYKYLFF